MKKHLLLLSGILILSFTTRSFGQHYIPQETVGFSIPKSIYFGGEKIWISASANAQSLESSNIIYAELINRNSESVAIAKMPLEAGNAFNFLIIPTDLPSDNYLLRVFTRISPYGDIDKGIQQELITIFNQKAPPEVVPTHEYFINQVESGIKLSKSEIKKEDQFSVTIPSDIEIDEISVAASNPFLFLHKSLSSTDIYQDLADRAIVPELYGHIVEAKVLSVPVDTTRLYYLSLHGDQSVLLTDRPDAGGRLFFDAGGMKHWNYLIAQSNYNESLTNFEIVSPAPKTTFKESFQIPILQISPSDQVLLTALLQGGQVEEYFIQEFDSSPLPVVTGFVEDRVYLLDDYTRFDDVQTVLKEYVPEILVRSRQKEKIFRVLDVVNETAFQENPLMLIDALPVFDSDMVARFNPKKFKKLEVLTRSFFLNEEVFPGVVSFTSYKNDFGGFPLPSNAIYLGYQGILPRIRVKGQLFEMNSAQGSMKDWRTILYWSKAPLSNEISPELKLKASSLSGEYQITIIGKDPEGKKVTLFQYFNVK